MGFILSKILFMPPVNPGTPSINSSFVRTASGVDIPIVNFDYPDAEYTIVFSHGNACNLYHIEDALKHFRNQFRCSVIGYDYVGYGHSKYSESVALNIVPYNVGGNSINSITKPVASEAGCYESIDAVFNFVTETLERPVEKQIWIGESLGSGPTVDLVQRICVKGDKKVAAMILVNPFWSVTQVVSSILPWLIDMFPNGGKIGAIDVPVLIISSEQDEVIPAVHRQWLHEKCQKSRLVKLPGARHNDAFIDPVTYSEIVDFITKEVKK
jgi:hypothetical protein